MILSSAFEILVTITKVDILRSGRRTTITLRGKPRPSGRELMVESSESRRQMQRLCFNPGEYRRT